MLNQLDISERITTSGQPGIEQLQQIAEQGFEAIINLAMCSSDNAIVDEADRVTVLGMAYVHIPVPWESPQPLHFQLFANTMQALSDKKVWVHCALNYRVSAFMYLYSRLYLNRDEESARSQLMQIWQPNAVWEQWLQAILDGHP